MKSTGSWYLVRTDDGSILRCRVRGKFKLKESKTTNPVSVGDHVEVKLDIENPEVAVIENIHPRENYVIRKSVHKTSHGNILASNVDQAILVATLAKPRTSLGFIDRFLVACESFRIPAAVLFNKSDMLNSSQMLYQAEISNIFKSIGYKVFSISALEGTGLENLEELLKNKVTLVAGHSGVGKSTLLNRISKDISQKVDVVSESSLKGKHTTTFAEMFELSKNTFIIDTPGIKELGMIDMENWEISHYFPEMRNFLGQCKFNNCLHINEPGCKVLEALAKEEIHISRFESYLSILEDEDNRR